MMTVALHRIAGEPNRNCRAHHHPSAGATGRSTRARLCWKAAGRLLALLAVSALLAPADGLAALQVNPAPAEDDRQVHVVRVPLPIDGKAADQVLQILKRIVDQAPAVADPDLRPLVILQFDTDRGNTGAGSDLAHCFQLARFLANQASQKIKTIAYLPGLRNSDELTGGEAPPQARLVGHAILVAIVAEELVLDQQVTIGDAAVDEAIAGPELVNMYRDLAALRLTLPLGIVKSMVDPAETLHAVTTTEGERLTNLDELRQLEQAGKVIQSETLSAAGETAHFSADVLERFSVNVHRVADRQQLAVRYGVDLSAIEAEVAERREWRAVRFEFPDYITQRSVSWALRALEADLRDRNVNLILLQFDSTSGELATCLQLANYLANFDPEQVRTVAFVPQTVSGPAALAALACDQIIFSDQGQLGGRYDPPLSPEELAVAQSDLERLARVKDRDLALFKAVLFPEQELTRVRHQRTGQLRWFTVDDWNQRDDQQEWAVLEVLNSSEGIQAARADADRIARTLLNDWEQLESFYQLSEPARVLTPTGVDQTITWLAQTLAAPSMAFLLLFGGMFLISTEMSSPGLGVPGFLGALCFVLFFWSQHLGGNAGWLEVLLFVLGVAFIALELFVLPGMGIFGIGGLLLVVTSLVLATQTFIIPRNSAEFKQLPVSLGMVVAALSGLVVAMFLMRRYLPHAPFFRRLMLEPPAPEIDGTAGLAGAASLVSVGDRGTTVTRLLPSGKAKFAGKVLDVISDGEMVDPRTTVEVVEVTGNRVVVRSLPRP